MRPSLPPAPAVERHGARIPRLGFGTWRLAGAACRRAVEEALALGYCHIDTAAMYGNEAEVGAALTASGVPARELFVTTKVWRDDLAPDLLLRSAEASLRRLKRDAVDLLLIHWPNAGLPLAESIAALNAARTRGLARHIGVSNFPSALLCQAVELSDAPILVNQCEYHPELDQSVLIAACAALGTTFVAYRPLGQGRSLSNEAVLRIAARHGKTAGQVILRWHMQHADTVAIPRSADPAHIAENLAVFDFALSDVETAAINALAHPGGRHVNPAWAPAWDRTGLPEH